jgi:hypothetical protein
MAHMGSTQIAHIEELDASPTMEAQLMYAEKLYSLPLMCWARAATPAMPSLRSESVCPLP